MKHILVKEEDSQSVTVEVELIVELILFFIYRFRSILFFKLLSKLNQFKSFLLSWIFVFDFQIKQNHLFLKT